MGKTHKTAVEQTPEQKKVYWKKRVAEKMISAMAQFNPQYQEVYSMAKHIGVKQDRLDTVNQKISDAVKELMDLVNEA